MIVCHFTFTVWQEKFYQNSTVEFKCSYPNCIEPYKMSEMELFEDKLWLIKQYLPGENFSTHMICISPRSDATLILF